MKIIIASDHGGFDLKQHLKGYISSLGYSILDFGIYSKETADYPDIAYLVAKEVAKSENTYGIIIDGAGIGSCIAANKVKGIRAAVCNDTFSARNSKAHNDANILTIGSNIVGLGKAFDIVRIWLSTTFEGGRHKRRVDKIKAIENKEFK